MMLSREERDRAERHIVEADKKFEDYHNASIPLPCEAEVLLAQARRLLTHADSADKVIEEKDKVIEGLVDALEVAHDDFIRLPSGADLDADPNNASPEDGAAHNAGLAVKRIQAALAAAGNIGNEKPC